MEREKLGGYDIRACIQASRYLMAMKLQFWGSREGNGKATRNFVCDILASGESDSPCSKTNSLISVNQSSMPLLNLTK